MNPEIKTLFPKYFPKGKFFLIPLRENDKPIFIHLSGKKYKIYEHMNGKEKSFSIGIEINAIDDEYNFNLIQEKEAKIQNLAMENLSEIQSKFNFKKDDFHIIKKDRSGKNKIYAKVPFKNDKIIPTFWEAFKLRENQKPKKTKTNPLEVIGEDLHGDVVVEIKQIFISNKFKSITCVVQEALFWEIEKPESFFDKYEEPMESSDEYED